MISSREIISIFKAIRNYCLDKYKDDIPIDDPVDRDNRLGILNYDEMSEYLSHDVKSTPIMQVPMLVKTPRLLKLVLRQTKQAWESLHGEINYDDLFMANVLRYAAPEAYDFLLDNFREIRGLQFSKAAGNNDKKINLQLKWDNISHHVIWNKNAAEDLIAFLFPSWNNLKFSVEKYALQGVNRSEPTDYWIRLNKEDLTDADVRDQEVLAALNNWKSDKKSTSFKGMTLPMALYQNDLFNKKAIQFGSLFLTGKEIRFIAHSLFRIMLEENETNIKSNGFEVFKSLWRLSLKNTINRKEHDKWILTEIIYALPKSLDFANNLYYYWRHKDRPVEISKLSKTLPDLRHSIITEAKKLFNQNPNKLIDALDPGVPFSVFQFSVLFSHQKEGGSGFKPEEWEWLSNILTSAARLDPHLIVPQIVSFLVTCDREVYKINYNLNIKLAGKLFGKKLLEVMKLLSKEMDFEHLTMDTQKSIEFAREKSSEWIKRVMLQKNK